MDPVDLAFAGVARQAELVRSSEVSPTELTELYLGRIERLNPQINCFNAVYAEEALAEAKGAEKRLGSGESGPLLGVPIAIKDNVDIAGKVTSFGTGAFERPAAEDAEIVKRLRAAGAVVLGKTTLPELAICGYTETKTWGITRNPWNLERTPGGSSGGSAAAVAAGMAAAAFATDGMGSIRIPAHNCGLFGLKPQRDRVTLAPDTEHWHGLSVFGFLTRSVLDTALLLDVAMAGEPMAGAPPKPERPFAGAAGSPPGKLKVAWSTKPIRAILPPTVTDEVKGAVTSTAEMLGGLGHEVEEHDPSWGRIGDHIVPRYLGGVHTELEGVENKRALEPKTRGFGRLGAVMAPKGRLAKAKGAWLEADRERIDKLFERFDVLITPVVGEPAIEVGRWEDDGALRTLLGMSRAYPFCPPWNHTGQPACNVPAGFSADGTPLGAMMIARPNDEATLLSLAAQIESARPWADERPAVAAE